MNARAGNLILVCAFFCAITLPMVGSVAPIAPDVGLRENRALAPSPEPVRSFNDLKKYPDSFNRFYDDHFGFRDALVKTYNHIDNSLLNSRDRVIRGEAGWFFLGRGIRGDISPIPIVRDLCGKVPFPLDELAGWRAVLEKNAAEAEARGMIYLVVIVPNKHTIHWQFLPEEFRCEDAVTRLDQLMNVLRPAPGLNVLDIRDSLKTAYPPNIPLFRQTDTHWNALGQFAGYRAIIKMLDRLTGDQLSMDENRLTIYHDAWGGGDLALMANLPHDYKDIAWHFAINDRTAVKAGHELGRLTEDPGRQPERFVNERGNGRKLLMFHDSFTDHGLKAVMAETFSDSTFVWWGPPALDFAIVDRAKPDIIIQEMVERSLLHPHIKLH